MTLNYEIHSKKWAIEKNEDGTFNPDYLDSTVKSFEEDIQKSLVELEQYKKQVEERKAWIKANVRQETRVCISHSNNPTNYLVYREEHYVYPEGSTTWYYDYNTKKEFRGQTAQKDALAHMATLMREKKPTQLSGANYFDKLVKLFTDDRAMQEFILSEKKRIDEQWKH